MKDTKQQFEHVIAVCRDLFAKKLHDYGAAWRIMRPSSVTDQIFIKANRIRSIEIKGVTMVDEGIRSEFIAIVNYGIIGLIQLELGYADTDDMTEERALELYDRYAKQALELMLAKNHDYDEAWRSMRVSSYTDLILMKIYRTKQIEGLSVETHRGADSIHPPCIVLFWQTAFRQSYLSGIKGWRIVLPCSYSLSARKGNKHRTCQKRMQGASVYECRQTLFCHRLSEHGRRI